MYIWTKSKYGNVAILDMRFNLKIILTFRRTRCFCTNIKNMETEACPDEVYTITEGLAKVKTSGKVFYNPVQEFNRDLRLVLDVFTIQFD